MELAIDDDRLESTVLLDVQDLVDMVEVGYMLGVSICLDNMTEQNSLTSQLLVVWVVGGPSPVFPDFRPAVSVGKRHG